MSIPSKSLGDTCDPMMEVPSTTSARGAEAEQTRWFSEEVQPHESALRTWLRGRFPSLWDVDDLVQETYARVFRARLAGKIAEARPYLFATARNTAIGIYRRSKIVSIEPIAEISQLRVVEDRPDAAEAAAHQQELAMLAEAISALPDRCRQVMTLRKLHGLSQREIARQLGIAINTVNAQAALGVLRCREYLQSRGVGKGGRR